MLIFWWIYYFISLIPLSPSLWMSDVGDLGLHQLSGRTSLTWVALAMMVQGSCAKPLIWRPKKRPKFKAWRTRSLATRWQVDEPDDRLERPHADLPSRPVAGGIFKPLWTIGSWLKHIRGVKFVLPQTSNSYVYVYQDLTYYFEEDQVIYLCNMNQSIEFVWGRCSLYVFILEWRMMIYLEKTMFYPTFKQS